MSISRDFLLNAVTDAHNELERLRAVNAALVEVLEAAAHGLEQAPDYLTFTVPLAQVRAAIALAKGEKT